MARPTTLAERQAIVQRPKQAAGADVRTCNKCGEAKAPEEFYPRYDHASLLMATCKECKRAYARRYHTENKDDPQFKEKRRGRRIRFEYGIDNSEYERLLAAQGGTCAGCHTTEPGRHEKFDIDHDHQTGKVRGLLCGNCNRALGLLKDSAETAANLATYLAKHEER